jgi:rod shape determining protein RodA
MLKTVPQSRFKTFLQPWQGVDGWLFVLPIALTIAGGIMIQSTELTRAVTEWWQHWVTGAIGLGFVLVISCWRYEKLLDWHWVIYGLTNVSLIVVKIIGTTVNGAQSWITIGDFNVQPSEFAKLGLIITLAAVLHKQPANTLPALGKTLAIAAVPWFLVLIQPDLGTSLVFGAITLAMLYWGHANPGWLLLLVSPIVSVILFNAFLPGWIIWAAITVFVAWLTLPWRWYGAIGALLVNLAAGELGQIAWGLLKTYQKNRLLSFLNPAIDPQGSGYHLNQSRIAIGSGQMWGRGLYQGTQTQLHFIPEQHTDFIFSAIGEELGFIGAIVILITFWIICLRLVMIATKSKDDFGSLLVVGFLSLIVFQVAINIGMTIGLAPVTGIPLPWLSYGRSALLKNFLALGIVQSVAKYRPRKRKYQV